ncbi:MAG: small multi-drug export protein [Dehalococcoidales bacterium]
MIAINFLLVAALAVLELWAAVPLGFVMGLHPLAISVATATGAIICVFIVIFAGKHLRSFLLKFYEQQDSDKKPGLVQRIWQKYGVIGLGLLSPFLTGVLFGAAIGVASGIPGKKLVFWMTIGIILWTAILVLLGVAGIKIFS